jgi:hypothetical protein
MAGGEKRLANAYLLEIISPCPEIIRLVPRLAREFEDPILMMSMAFTIRAEWRRKWFEFGECQSGRRERLRGQKKEWIRKKQLDPSAFKTVSIRLLDSSCSKRVP